jgi:hypothetical protein
MKKLLILSVLLLCALVSIAQDTAPTSPKIFNPSPTFYKSVSGSDTTVSAKSGADWWNLARESWVGKYYVANSDSTTKYITPYALQHKNWNFKGSTTFSDTVFFDTAKRAYIQDYSPSQPGYLKIFGDVTYVFDNNGLIATFGGNPYLGVEIHRQIFFPDVFTFTNPTPGQYNILAIDNQGGQTGLVENVTIDTLAKYTSESPVFGGIVKTPVIGTIYNNDNFTSLTGLNQNGATGSIVGNQLQVSSGTGDYKHTIDIPGGTLLDNWVATVDIVAPTAATGASFGVGVRSTNVNSPTFLFSKIAKLDLSNGANAGKLTLQGGVAGATTLVTAPNILVITAGDTIRIYANRNGPNITIRATDKTHPQNDVTTTYYTSASNNGLSTLQNTGTFSLFATSTTPVNVVKWNVYSNTPIGADIGLQGDSKLLGGGSTVYANSTAGLLSQYFTVVNQGGGGDCTADMLLRLPEMMKLANHYLIFNGGRNDLVAGISLSTIEANLTTMADTAIAHHIPFYFLTGYYENTQSQIALAVWIRSAYPNNYIENLIPTTADAGSVWTDNIHPSDVGHALTVKAILTSGKIPYTKTPSAISSTDITNATGWVSTPGGITFGGTLGGLTSDVNTFSWNDAMRQMFLGTNTGGATLNILSDMASTNNVGASIIATTASNAFTTGGLSINVSNTGTTGSGLNGLNVTVSKTGMGSSSFIGESLLAMPGSRASGTTNIIDKGQWNRTYGSSALTSTETNVKYITNDNEVFSLTAVGEGSTEIAVRGKASGLSGMTTTGILLGAVGGTNNYALDDSAGSMRIRPLTASKPLYLDANNLMTNAGPSTSSNFQMGDGSFTTVIPSTTTATTQAVNDNTNKVATTAYTASSLQNINADILPTTTRTINLGSATLNFNIIRATQITANNTSLSLNASNSAGVIELLTNNIENARLITNGNFLIGGSTDGGYRNDIQASGTNGYFKAGNFSINTTGNPVLNGPLILNSYTVATLPTGTVGMIAYVTDAASPVALTAVTAGGSSKVTVFYSGTNWIVQ